MQQARAADAMERRATLLLMAAAAAVALLFLASMWSATGGQFVPQVADLYLVCQYARAMAEGHPFQYNAGEAATSGATSLLHTGILAAAHRAGFRGEGLVAFAILSGAALYVATVKMARDVGALLGGPREGWLAGGLVTVGGPVVWGFLYGADVGLFMFLTVWLLRSLLIAWPAARFGPVAAPAILAALTRPEGLPLAVLVGAGWWLGPGRQARGAERALPWAGAVAGLLVLANNRAFTGSWVGTSLADKSLFANFGIASAIGIIAEYGVDVIRGLLLGFYPSSATIGFNRGWAALCFPPLGLVLIAAAALRRHPLAPPLRLWLVATAVLFALVSPNMFLGIHFNRYILWAFPTLLAMVAAGAGVLARAAPGGTRDRAIFNGMAALFLGLGFLSTLRFAALYGEMAGEIHRRDLAAARWISRSLPAGVAMANVATSVEYLTGHRNVNLHGVTSPAFLGTRAGEREAGMLEGLGRLAERPPYLITTVASQEGSALLRELVDGPPLFRTTSFGDEIEIYRTRYDALVAAARVHRPETARAVAALTEVDRLNICDPADEAAHGYRFDSRLGNLRLLGSARVDRYAAAGGDRVADAGRAIIGSESFEVNTTPGRDLVIVIRTAQVVPVTVLRPAGGGGGPLQFVEAELDVIADGRPAAHARFRPDAGWDEAVVLVPGAALTRTRTRLEVVGRYAAYRYWFYQ
jgi:hypothetical protein